MRREKRHEHGFHRKCDRYIQLEGDSIPDSNVCELRGVVGERVVSTNNDGVVYSRRNAGQGKKRSDREELHGFSARESPQSKSE